MHSAMARCGSALRSWAASQPDHRFRLGPRGAPALLHYAAQTERAHGLDQQAPLWLGKPTGWLHGEAVALVQRLFAAANDDLIQHVWKQPGVVALDLRLPIEPQLPGAAEPVVQAARRVAAVAAAIAVRRRVEWSEARLVLTDRSIACHPDDTFCRVTLETRTPFHRVDAWINDAFDLAGHCWLPIGFWPDAGDLVRGPGKAVGFYPDGSYRHWRRRSGHELRRALRDEGQE